MSALRRGVGPALGAASKRLLEGMAEVEFPARLGVSLTHALVELRGQRRKAPNAARPGAGDPRPLRAHPVRLRHALPIGIALVCISGVATASSVWLAPAGNPLYGFNPGLVSTAPPAAQLDALAVLRRPQSAGDRGPGVQAALTDVNNFSSGLRSDYVRVLETTSAGAVVLVPVQKRYASAAGAGVASAIDDALCVYYPFGGPGSLNNNVHCWSTQQLLAGQAAASIGAHVYGLVPDGVRSVRVAAGSSTMTVPVVGNFFDVARSAGTGGPPAALPIPPTVTLSRSAG